MARFDLRRFARLGAEERILRIRHEVAEILRQFPDLDAPRTARGSPYPPNELAALGGREKPAPARKRRRKMTAAQRKAVGERMRKYWAARKGAAKKR